jgi:hypothetical protein
LRRGLERRLDIDGAHAAHYWLEDSRGVRVLDFHNGSDQALHLVRPIVDGPAYLRRADDALEWVLPSSPDVLSLGDLESGRVRVAVRGAAHEAYNLLFSLPFDRGVVARYVEPPPGVAEPPAAVAQSDTDPATARTPPVRRALGWGAVGLGAVGGVVGAVLSTAAVAVAGGSSHQEDQFDVARRNARISTLNAAAMISYLAGGASLGTGAVLLLWPNAQNARGATPPASAYVGYRIAF